MSDRLSKEVRESLADAGKARRSKKSRLHVQAGGRVYPVLRLWKTGFAVEAERVPRLRGLVDIYDGPRHLCHALILAAGDVAGERIFEFKSRTPAEDRAPLDFARETPAPAALLPRWPGMRFIAGRRRPPAAAPPPPPPGRAESRN